MKVRESGMPEEETWNGFFDVKAIMKKMNITERVRDIVDFGCGYGTFSIPVAKAISGRVYAIDIELEMVEETKRKVAENKLINVKTILRDFVTEGSGLESESVDYVMLFNILHAKEPKKLLRGAYRILRPNGKIGIIHWNYDLTTPRGPPMEIRPKPEQCIQWATHSGFNRPIQHDLKPHHYGIVMEKK